MFQRAGQSNQRPARTSLPIAWYITASKRALRIYFKEIFAGAVCPGRGDRWPKWLDGAWFVAIRLPAHRPPPHNGHHRHRHPCPVHTAYGRHGHHSWNHILFSAQWHNPVSVLQSCSKGIWWSWWGVRRAGRNLTTKMGSFMVLCFSAGAWAEYGIMFYVQNEGFYGAGIRGRPPGSSKGGENLLGLS